jgi:hypothetical protein
MITPARLGLQCVLMPLTFGADIAKFAKSSKNAPH